MNKEKIQQMIDSVKKEDLKIGFDKGAIVTSVYAIIDGKTLIVKDYLNGTSHAEKYIENFNSESERDNKFINPNQRKKIYYHSGMFELEGKLYKPENEENYNVYKMNNWGKWEFEKTIDKLEIDY